MTVKLYNKKIDIPDNVLAIAMRKLNISKDEAIEMWLDDHDYTTNEEQEQLEDKAKNVKINHDAQAVKEKKATRKREKKENQTKKAIISALFDALNEKLDDISSVSIRNDEKYIDFVLNNVEYTINLVAHRPKK